jgi:hypothetical protein
MSITAELRWPNRLNWCGKYLFEKGVPQEIDRETAAILDADARFEVRGCVPAEAAEEPRKGKVVIKKRGQSAEKAVEVAKTEGPNLEETEEGTIDATGDMTLQPDEKTVEV